MKAIILCAGYATRLYPLTLNKPKSLLPIGEKPLLSHIIERVNELDEVDDIFIVTNEKFYMNFVWWLNQYKGNFNKKIEIINDNTSSKEDRLGSIGDLWFVIDEKNIQDDLLVINGDKLFDCSLKQFVDFFKEKKEIVNGVYELEAKEDLKKHGIVELKEGKIIDFEEKPEEPKTNFASVGLYIFPREDIEKIEKYMKTEKSKDASGYLIQHFIKIKDVYGFMLSGKHYDIGTIEDYEKIKDKFKK